MNVKEHTIKDIITESLIKSMSYPAYRKLVSVVVAEGKSTGDKQSEALSNYSMLNDKRMKRLDKTTRLTESHIEAIKLYDEEVTWLVLTESWCGDAAQTMPMMNKIAELNDKIDFKVVLRDDNPELMSEFLTNGNLSIPKLIAFHPETKEVKGTFGPRPSIAIQMVAAYKKEHGALDPEFKRDLQVWYNKDKGQNTAEDLVALLK
ncbi:MAG: thioredoxin family protein [Flavobacteriaceae bacterium]|nr:thioredoxin family protein [Flavobacteriaceae bacterium]